MITNPVTDWKELLQKGTVIPAHPLALLTNRSLDEPRQRLLTQYYIASGAGGVAVGVHTTQFNIRKPGIDLLEPVLKIAADEIDKAIIDRPFIRVAGICGPDDQAVREAIFAKKYGYQLGLLSMGGLSSSSEKDLITRTHKIAEIIPVFGFYLQPAVGGRLLSHSFWKEFAEIPGVLAIKVAAFNRYHTLDVVRAVAHSKRNDEIALYTGNDDNIVADLLTRYRFSIGDKTIEKRFVGGLLGHWSFWTSRVTELFSQIKNYMDKGEGNANALLSMGAEITDINAAVFDAANGFKGCIPGIHEILFRQGLLAGTTCLDATEKLSSGQMEEIDRVYAAYPSYNDDEFVKNFLSSKNIVHSC